MARRGPGPDHSDGPMVFVESLEAPTLSDDDRHHLGRVLRVRPGAAMTVCDGCGAWRRARFGDVVESTGPIERTAAPSPPVTIGFAIPKGDRPELIVQKLTELGVDRIVPLVAARSVVRWDAAKAARQRERFERVAREAAMQCRRTWLPAVEPVVEVAELARTATVDGGKVALAERGGTSLRAWMDGRSNERSAERSDADPWVVLVGPEGGWSSDELAAVPGRVAVGDHVLRVETAAIAAAALLTAERAGRRAGA